MYPSIGGSILQRIDGSPHQMNNKAIFDHTTLSIGFSWRLIHGLVPSPTGNRLEDSARAIAKIEFPRNLKDLAMFLGMLGYHRQTIRTPP